MGKKPRTRSALPTITQDDIKRISDLEVDDRFWAEIDVRFGICTGKVIGPRGYETRYYRHLVVAAFRNCAEALRNSDRRVLARASCDRIARALNHLLQRLDEQKAFDVADPQREGLELFALCSQREEVWAQLTTYSPDRRPDGLATFAEQSFIGPLRLHEPILLPQDEYKNVGDFHTIVAPQGWLETLLREISGKLSPEPVFAEKRGPKGKAAARNYIFSELAAVFTACGGKVSEFNNSVTGRVEGQFVDFVEQVVDQCPSSLKDYLKLGLREAIRVWLKKGRPESERIHRLDLGVQVVGKTPPDGYE